MKLSIVIPMYNTEKYIKSCIDSLLNQNISKKDYEIIIVDDGSNDKSLEIINNLYKDIENLKVISVKNGGQSYARNIGIDKANGEYLLFVDSDDYVAHNSLSEILDLAVEKQLDMLFFDIKRVNDIDNSYICRYKDLQNFNIVNGKKYFSNNNVNNGPWHFLISRTFIKANNIRFIEGRFCEDGMFLISCIFKARRVAHCDVDIYRYVCRNNSTVSIRDKKHLAKIIDDFLYAIEYINEYYEEAIREDLSQEFIKRLKSRRNSYIFFMQIRMIKAKLGYKHCKQILERLKKINCYKYERMSKEEYSDKRITIMWKILNNELIFGLLCR